MDKISKNNIFYQSNDDFHSIEIINNLNKIGRIKDNETINVNNNIIDIEYFVQLNETCQNIFSSNSNYWNLF